MKIVTSYNTEICSKCGTEVHTPLKLTEPNSNSYNTHTPFMIGYSRKKRFAMMVDCVLFPSSNPADDGIMEFLWKNKPISTMDSLFKLLKINRSKDKRYCSLHLFAKIYIPTYKAPTLPPRSVRKVLLTKFCDMEFLHKRYMGQRPFFNYCWLLRKFLHQVGCVTHMKFVKKLKCRRRRKAYQQMYDDLLSRSHKF